jgi:hypothetical protein
MTGQNDHEFRISSYCGSGACVEVAQRQDGSIAVRDSKDRAHQELIYSRDEWIAFIRGAKAGEFDFGVNVGAGVDSTTMRLFR